MPIQGPSCVIKQRLSVRGGTGFCLQLFDSCSDLFEVRLSGELGLKMIHGQREHPLDDAGIRFEHHDAA
jgi:hypothetical protein